MRKVILIPLFVVMAGLVGCSSCGGTPYEGLARGYRAVNLSAKLTEDFDSALYSYLAAKHAECKTKHTVKTPEFDQCVLPAVKLARAWSGEKNNAKTGKGILPTIQDAQKATKLALDQGYDYVKSHEAECKDDASSIKCGGDWLASFKRIICPLSIIIDRGVKIGAYKATDSQAYKSVMAFVDLVGGCK